MKISVNYSGDYSKILTSQLKQKIQTIHYGIHTKTAVGADYLGWVDWPSSLRQDWLKELHDTAKDIREKSNVLVVIGIGGSYLGTKAFLEALSKNFQPFNKLEVIFAGHLVSGTYLKQLMQYLDSKEVTINVISKSGTTTEPAIASRFLIQYMENRYREQASSRIIVTTDENKGALRTLAIENGYKRLIVPNDI
ncbi:MAG TPA: glucose-6-phosphate isomerase, partial [Rummeliibacillus sp.]|nr:glucose-6-phosphate isomerase [Rummeliibacillus sp.]